MFYYSILESHILEDVNKCVLALQEGSADPLDRTAGAIRGRSARVCNVVAAEMDNYEPGIYTERVLEAIKVLRDQGKYKEIKNNLLNGNVKINKYLLCYYSYA